MITSPIICLLKHSIDDYTAKNPLEYEELKSDGFEFYFSEAESLVIFKHGSKICRISHYPVSQDLIVEMKLFTATIPFKIHGRSDTVWDLITNKDSKFVRVFLMFETYIGGLKSLSCVPAKEFWSRVRKYEDASITFDNIKKILQSVFKIKVTYEHLDIPFTNS